MFYTTNIPLKESEVRIFNKYSNNLQEVCIGIYNIQEIQISNTDFTGENQFCHKILSGIVYIYRTKIVQEHW